MPAVLETRGNIIRTPEPRQDPHAINLELVPGISHKNIQSALHRFGLMLFPNGHRPPAVGKGVGTDMVFYPVPLDGELVQLTLNLLESWGSEDRKRMLVKMLDDPEFPLYNTFLLSEGENPVVSVSTDTSRIDRFVAIPRQLGETDGDVWRRACRFGRVLDCFQSSLHRQKPGNKQYFIEPFVD